MIEKISQQFSLNKELFFVERSPGFPVIMVKNEWASAAISLYGGQVLEFQPHQQAEPVLWLSDKAIFQYNKAIRGGVPVCWPWFGAFADTQASLPSHGYARTTLWELISTQSLTNGETQIILALPCHMQCQQYQKLQAHFSCDLSLKITIGKQLDIELVSTNQGDTMLSITNALHAYFNISDIHSISISGLEKTSYLNKIDKMTSLQENELNFVQEMDRVYMNTTSDIMLKDKLFGRIIRVTKHNSHSTVIWNPWQENSRLMPDMSDDGWLSMVCIEPSNVHPNQVKLEPGQSNILSTSISVDNDDWF